MSIKKVLCFLMFGALVYGVAALSVYFTDLTVSTWYQTLEKPTWTPPDWLFSPVWTTLYFLIAIAGYLLFINRHNPQAKTLFTIWWAQLICNGFWTFLFFALKQPFAAALDILVIWILIALFMWRAWKYKKTLTLLFLPYLIWVTYAGAINWSICFFMIFT